MDDGSRDAVAVDLAERNCRKNAPFGLHQKNYKITNPHHLAGGCAVKITVTPSVGERINCF